MGGSFGAGVALLVVFVLLLVDVVDVQFGGVCHDGLELSALFVLVEH